MNRNDLFDRNRLSISPLGEREHDLDIKIIKALKNDVCKEPKLKKIVQRIKSAKEKKAAVIMIAGAHLFRSGVQRYVIDMMERGMITLFATNGAGIIHDFEFSLIGATTESVAKYISEGRFGLWKETGSINDFVNDGAKQNLGLGEAIGKAINEGDFPYKETSLFATAYRLGIPATVHVGIGYDIVHEHPNCNGAAYGQTSYTDFLRFAKEIENLEGGVVMNFGSSVMGPEVYLKALAMARNVAHNQKREICSFSTLVCDLVSLDGDHRSEPPKDDPAYYFRPWKTMLARTVADGGESFYLQGRHENTIPQLWHALTG